MTRSEPLVVVIAYHSDQHLPGCLGALGGQLDVLVVDNADSPSTRALAEQHGASYVANGSNLGFGSAVNLGLDRSGSRDVLLLNPDARIAASDVLRLQHGLHDPDRHRGAVGPLLKDESGSPEPADWPLPSPSYAWVEAAGLARRYRGRRFVTGAVLMLRAEAVAEVGGFDERFFLYAEESDWQRRAQDAGWEVAVVPEVEAMHVGGASSSDPDLRDLFFNASARAFARRWHGRPGALVMRGGAVAAASRRALFGPDRRVGRRTLAQQLRSAHVPREARRPSVVHVVVTNSFAGVERSVVDLATEQHRRGWRVSVVGGDQGAMRAELPAGVTLLPAATTREAVHSLRRLGPHDVMHAHMTAAELACVVIKPAVGGRLVATRHFAARRGSSAPGRVIAPLLARAIDQQVAISDFVASEMDGDGLVVHNGVRPSVAATPRQPTVVVLQRLEMEKQTDVALRAWAASGLADRGWRMVVHGRGAQQPALERLRAELGVTASVTLEGFTNAPRVALAAASVLLATAPGEPFGLTVAEAMAEGTPVVAADGGAHRELLGDLGYYFPPGDAQAAAEALLEAVALDDGDRSRLADDLRERQAAHFSVHRQVDGLFEAYRPPPRIAVLSLETWDGVWRRNQHVASRVVDTGAASSLLFVTPPHGGLAVRARRWSPQPGIEVVTPPLLVPRSRGGHRILARWLRHATRDVDLIWVNDPVAGATCLRPDVPVLYDVTDDWRRMDQPARDRARIVAAEDRLARSAETVVCSPWLADRWLERYGVEATLIGNGVDARAIRNAVPMETSTPGPHVVYVGTLHPNRIDVDLLVDLAEQGPGTLHLVGPESLGGSTRARLAAAGAALHGPVRSTDVPRWLAIADVLVCPHRVDDFTLSLDAIKAYEYLATNTPVVATPSSGFQDLTSPGLSVVTADKFVDAVAAAVGSGPFYRRMPVDWDDRAADFSAVVRRCASQDRRRSR